MVERPFMVIAAFSAVSMSDFIFSMPANTEYPPMIDPAIAVMLTNFCADPEASSIFFRVSSIELRRRLNESDPIEDEDRPVLNFSNRASRPARVLIERRAACGSIG
ncbi:hypothetical protein [Leptospira stimsonii]|uniref:hypothetical protein n=1 Tax=Leptospira stimsonii TaxID=2202203 RepID=UPI001FEE9803|nr:hypothetical protein [Leptospira stimsonii]